MSRPIVVHADWDPDAAVWVATTQDLRGLVTEAETVEALRAKLPGMILDLLEEYGVSDLPALIEIIARRERSISRSFVGWAKARSAVPTRLICAIPRGLRFAQPTLQVTSAPPP